MIDAVRRPGSGIPVSSIHTYFFLSAGTMIWRAILSKQNLERYNKVEKGFPKEAFSKGHEMM